MLYPPNFWVSLRLSVRPSAVDHSCPLHNFDTVRHNFTKLGTNIMHNQTTCRVCEIIPLYNVQCRNRVRSITLIPLEIISQNLVEIESMTRRRAEIKTVTQPTLIPFEIISQNLVQIKVWPDFDCELLLLLHFFRFYAPFVILYMVSMEIVSFCRIIPLCNFQYRNHAHSITLISFQIISQNLIQI